MSNVNAKMASAAAQAEADAHREGAVPTQGTCIGEQSKDIVGGRPDFTGDGDHGDSPEAIAQDQDYFEKMTLALGCVVVTFSSEVVAAMCKRIERGLCVPVVPEELAIAVATLFMALRTMMRVTATGSNGLLYLPDMSAGCFLRALAVAALATKGPDFLADGPMGSVAAAAEASEYVVSGVPTADLAVFRGFDPQLGSGAAASEAADAADAATTVADDGACLASGAGALTVCRQLDIVHALFQYHRYAGMVALVFATMCGFDALATEAIRGSLRTLAPCMAIGVTRVVPLLQDVCVANPLMRAALAKGLEHYNATAVRLALPHGKLGHAPEPTKRKNDGAITGDGDKRAKAEGELVDVTSP